TLTPLTGQPQVSSDANSTSRFPAFRRSHPLAFFDFLNIALGENPPPVREASLMSQFARIGVVAGARFQADTLDAATARGLDRAIQVGSQIVASPPSRPGT